MATKDVKARDEEDDLDDEEEEDDDPDAGEPVTSAQPVKSSPKPVTKPAPSAAKRPLKSGDWRAQGGQAKSHTKDAHGHHHDDGVDDETRDPSWWTPYAVLGGIVVVGVLGFFGAFSSTLKPLFSPPKIAAATHELPPATKPAEAPAPAPPPNGPAGAADAETFGAKHLLVMYKGSKRAPPTIERSKEDALARAKEALGKAKAPGAKFEELVGEYSDEPGAAKRGGNLGNFRRGAMVKEFQDALDKMKVGDISDVVETPFGYHVIQRTK
jgi:hypothetical protein